jgi:hypothetical protein
MNTGMERCMRTDKRSKGETYLMTWIAEESGAVEAGVGPDINKLTAHPYFLASMSMIGCKKHAGLPRALNMVSLEVD